MLTAALAWIDQHPLLVTYVLVPVAAGLFNWAAKPRSPEEYAAMAPRRAAFHRIMAGLFPDPKKTIEAAWQFWKNTHDRLPKP